MRPSIKIVIYTGLVAASVLFALCFREAYIVRAAKSGAPMPMGMGTAGAASLGCLFALGLFLARDFSTLFADKAYDFVFNDEGEGVKNPEYEQAEDVWRSGDYLEALRLLRDYYQRNPREIYVAIRIAEIYEKDLANYLAAALEYEQILQQKLPDERWAWAAIHLVNLYGKLNQVDKGTPLLQKIADQYGHTAAAKKARQRLGLPEPEPPPAAVAPPPEPEPEATPEPAPKPPEGPKLPMGFRPKK
jgi:TolA-binding protein